MKIRSRLLLTAALVLPQTVFAQGVIELDEALVTSGLIPVAVNETGASVEILDAGDIADGAATLDDTLKRLPGVSVTRTGTPGANADVRIRGLPQRYTGVTIDGIDVIDPSAPQSALNFGTMTRALADRIEVAKGPQTAVYGSDAIAGTVNITSWRPSEEGLSWGGQAEAGSFGWASSVLHLGYLDDRGEVALTLGAARSDGYSARPGNSEADGFSQPSLSFRVSRDVTDAVTLGVNGFWADSEVEDDDTDVDPTGLYFETKTGLRAFAEIRGDRIDHEISVSRYVIDREDPTGFDEVQRRTTGVVTRQDRALPRRLNGDGQAGVAVGEQNHPGGVASDARNPTDKADPVHRGPAVANAVAGPHVEQHGLPERRSAVGHDLPGDEGVARINADIVQVQKFGVLLFQLQGGFLPSLHLAQLVAQFLVLFVKSLITLEVFDHADGLGHRQERPRLCWWLRFKPKSR